ncbi:two component transcriptional regulator, winged helix family [Desulfobotulus alkaliphilus]|uniref:Two component transcriptional regulator, winged helix family n=1 Tax=Desulfobotulus alkaliphilus TaxID=622671 RepID=A0A562RRE3_9BACT|nr:response regulator [Desulfobotulus alkaliphilus]TWI71655.1 two component transcriptional regulator, winged helix family [Desulfobotulus alkaliphilus]
MAKEHILVVDDEEDILELIRYHLSREGYGVLLAGSGEEALRLVRDHSPDLMVLDLMLPGVDGLEVTRRIRRQPGDASLPIVMLTAKGEEADVVAGLELGADDYVTKPFSPRILLARIRSVLRRRKLLGMEKSQEGEKPLEAGGLIIHPGRHEVLADGEPLSLTWSEFQILHFLARRPGWVFTRTQIVDAIHGDDYPVTDRSVDVQIVGLRKKLGPHGKRIETVRGVGYRFRE